MDSNLFEIKNRLNRRQNLGDTLRELHDFFTQKNYNAYSDTFENICKDYDLVLDFMAKGYQDKKREELYKSLLLRTFTLIQNLILFDYIQHNNTYTTLSSELQGLDFSHETIQSHLEGFVTDVAMLSLEDESTRKEHQSNLYLSHHVFIKRLFEHILVAPLWNEGEMEFYRDLLLSPTIDAIDAQVIVSAITISCINIFDSYKLKLLTDVCISSADKSLHQRSLVGCALVLNPQEKLMLPQQREAIHRIVADSNRCKEFFKLQKQLIYCVNAEKDVKTIQDDLMPKIINNSNLNITKFGISEKEPDVLNEILHPDADDKAMNEMEETMRKMAEMEKAGSDIYFGGFRHMKRFSFFYTLSNWFTPFYIEHPDLSHVNDKLAGNRFMELLFKKGPFCDSDKYSFALAISGILSQIPENMKEMLNNEEAVIGPNFSIDINSDTYKRRMYLQDLYRFYMLYTNKADFRNPFVRLNGQGEPNLFFMIMDWSKEDVQKSNLVDLLNFLFKHNAIRNDDLDIMDKIMPNDQHAQLLTLKALIRLRNKNEECVKLFEEVLASEPDNHAALKGLARADMIFGSGEKAAKCYEKLLKQKPDSINYELNLYIALIKNKQADTAVEKLYKLSFEHPNDQNVSRVLAWGLLNVGKYEQALNEYKRILEGENSCPEDFLNAGYCYWLQNDIHSAIENFRKYVSLTAKTDKSIEQAFKEDSDMLNDKGIGETDLKIMADILKRN